MNQNSIFIKGEGDKWFLRNRDKLNRASKISKDAALFLIGKNKLKPKRVLEVGASNGWRLEEIRRKFGSLCTAIDPSRAAIKDGLKHFPKIKFKIGTASKIPLKKSEKFDLVIVYSVLHWVDRSVLIRSLAEIDERVADNGFLILEDFFAKTPLKTPYHHVENAAVYTYKIDYAKIFADSGLYKIKSQIIFDHDTQEIGGKIKRGRKMVCSLLKKSKDGYYKLFEI